MTRLRTGLRGLVAAAIVAAAIAIPPAPAKAQDSAERSGETYSASHLEKAQRVIDLTRSDENFDEILPIVAEQTITLIVRSYPALAREVEEVTTETALELAGTRAELNLTLQKIWARRFSEAELDRLIEFFSSETGGKFAELTPVIAALSVGASKQWSDRLATEMLTAVREELRARGHQL